MGDDAGLIRSPGTLKARVTGCASHAQAIVVRNGHALARGEVQDGGAELEVEIPVSEAPVRAWYRVDVIDAAGQALAISNPIFLGPPRTPPPTMFGSYAEKLLPG